MDRNEAIHKLAKEALISLAHAEDLYDSFVPKPVVPYYIADYIEEVKKQGDYTVVGAVNEAPDGRVRDWLFLERVNTFAQAWVNGYIVEGEPKYTVRLKGRSGQYLGKYYLNNEELIPQFTRTQASEGSVFTRTELESSGFDWVFNCPGVEVKEVE